MLIFPIGVLPRNAPIGKKINKIAAACTPRDPWLRRDDKSNPNAPLVISVYNKLKSRHWAFHILFYLFQKIFFSEICLISLKNIFWNSVEIVLYVIKSSQKNILISAREKFLDFALKKWSYSFTFLSNLRSETKNLYVLYFLGWDERWKVWKGFVIRLLKFSAKFSNKVKTKFSSSFDIEEKIRKNVILQIICVLKKRFCAVHFKVCYL